MRADETLLEVRELRKTYRVGFRRRRVEALRGVSFRVQRGEIFGLIGPNGAGKTTTIKILTGLIRSDGGEARLFEQPVTEVASRRRMGYLPEGPYFYEHLKVEELLRYYGSLHGLAGAELRRRVDDLVVRVGLDHARQRPLRKFSKGMRQRAGIAQALINDPELVILDEPQSGLDPVGRKDVRDLILDLKRQGKTVLLCSHILPDVEAVCDRVAVLHQGELVDIGTLRELTRQSSPRFEIVVRQVSSEAIAALAGVERVERRGELVWARLRDVGEQALWGVLDEVRATGAILHSVNAHRDSLEDVFVRDTRVADEEE